MKLHYNTCKGFLNGVSVTIFFGLIAYIRTPNAADMFCKINSVIILVLVGYSYLLYVRYKKSQK